MAVASVPISAIPIEPPSWRPTLSTADTMPDSSGRTCAIAVMLVETKTWPRPRASTTSGPSTDATYDAWSVIAESQNRPAAAISAPAAIGSLGPMRPASLDVTPAPTATPRAVGRNAKPAWSGVRPRTFCRKSVSVNRVPDSAAPVARDRAYAPDRLRFLKICSGMRGWRLNASMSRNASRSASAPPSVATVIASSQPWTAARESP